MVSFNRIRIALMTFVIAAVLTGCNGSSSTQEAAPTPTPTDTTAPMIQSSSVNGTSLSLVYNETLDSAHPAPVSAFRVSIDGAITASPTTVAVIAKTVTLTLAQPIICGNTVTVSYTDPSAANDTNATQDLAGNDAVSFAQRAVTNDTTASTAALTFTPNAGTAFGSSDASATLGLDSQFMIVGDDESNVVRVYPRAGGAAALEWNYGVDLPTGDNELDLESSARVGNTVYFMSSLSNKKTGATDPNRAYLFSATVSGTGATTQFTYLANRGDMKTQLVNWDKNNEHGLGANYFGFADSINGVVPENVNGFSIEGMTTSKDGQYLWLAFRAPQTDTTTRSNALIVPVQLSDIFTAATTTDTTTTLTFSTPIELNLGGRGIRSINKVADGTGYLIVAGPAGSASADVTNDFRLYTWDGVAANAPPNSITV
ncbi:MAG TPA: DUF3616 domain-containing protein [Halothiobacillus sp.]|nr:DUF3616 domain-containing protein [Halothiobacillus sp.]